MKTRGPTFGFMFPYTIGEELKIQNWSVVEMFELQNWSVVEMFELKDLATTKMRFSPNSSTIQKIVPGRFPPPQNRHTFLCSLGLQDGLF